MTQFFETTQGILVIGAILGIGCFAAGALLPAAFRWAFSPRALRQQGKTRSTAMLATLALDDFVGSCYAAVHDTPEFNPMNEGEFTFHTPDPVLALPASAELTALDADLVEEMMWLSNRVRNLSNALDSLDLSGPGFESFFERRQEGYAILAATAMDLIGRLLSEYDLQMPDKPDYYRQREGFAAIVQSAGERQLRRKPASKVLSTDSNVTHLFPRTGEE